MPDIDKRTKRGRDLAMRLNRQTVLDNMPKIYYVKDRGMYRVGRTDWPGDQFNILQWQEFEIFSGIYKNLGFELIDNTNDGED